MELDLNTDFTPLFEQPVVINTSVRLKKTPAQIILKWGIQRGCSIIPKSSNLAHLEENINSFGFELTENEMTDISNFDKGKRFNDLGVYCEQVFGTFCPIFE